MALFFAGGCNGIRGIRRGNGEKKIGIRQMRNSDAQLGIGQGFARNTIASAGILRRHEGWEVRREDHACEYTSMAPGESLTKF
jgi:hypothetical protein